MDRSLVVVCCAQHLPHPSPCFPSLTGMLVFCGAAQKSTFSGLLAHLVAGLWDRDGGGAAVDQGGQLVEADDAEEVA